MKKTIKQWLVSILSNQVKRLRANHAFRIVAVVGSIGKTSTKLAIAEMLETRLKVRYQNGNYNDSVSVPLVFFGHTMPALWNFAAWLYIIVSNEIQIRRRYPYEAVIVELGTDGPGQISEFASYLKVDVGVITAVAPEHMEFFADLDAVATEEWAIAGFSKVVLANKDLMPAEHQYSHNSIIWYGFESATNYTLSIISQSPKGFTFEIKHNGSAFVRTTYPAFSKFQLYSITAAAVIAAAFGFSEKDIRLSTGAISPVSGRMQRLRGLNNSTIIDDTYNASPAAVEEALLSLYDIPAPQHIALLGMMNELGEISEAEHRAIGKLCDPSKLDLVVTLGKHANLFIAPEARARGCTVVEYSDAREAGLHIANVIKEGAVILAKGSQNGVYAEEAVKQFLEDPHDARKLVRQSKAWLKKKDVK